MTALEVAAQVHELRRVYNDFVGSTRRAIASYKCSQELTDGQCAQLETSCEDILAFVGDLSVEVDDAMAQEVSAPLAVIEAATSSLTSATEHVLAIARIVGTVETVVGVAGRLAGFCESPNLAAAEDIASSLKALVASSPNDVGSPQAR